MSIEAPDRIWITQEDAGQSWPGAYKVFRASDLEHPDCPEYVRADKLEELAAEQAEPAPAYNAMFETCEDGITGTRYVDVKRVCHEDDGSITVVIDYRPEPAPAARSGAVKVKQLQWEDPEAIGYNIRLVATDLFGRECSRLYLTAPTDKQIDEAKAAAQADYEQRILAALEPAEPARDVEPIESCPDCAGSGYSNHPDSGQVCYRCDGQGSSAHPGVLRELITDLLSHLNPADPETLPLIRRAMEALR